MSKAVSSVARNVTNVVKGAANIVKSNVKNVVGVIKDVASSKLGKILITAAVIYFGGAALAGGFGSSAAGGSFLSGMSAGVSSAATSLSSAWGSAMAGELGTAGSTIGNSWGAAGTAGGATAGGNATAAVSGIDLGGAGSSPANMGTTTVAGGTPPPITPPATPPVTPPAANMSVGEGIMGAAKIQAGTALIGGAMQGKAAQEQRDAELEQARLARERYNANAGAQLWGSNQPAPSAGVPATGPQYGAFSYDPMAQAKSLNQQRWDEYQARQGLVSRNMV